MAFLYIIKVYFNDQNNIISSFPILITVYMEWNENNRLFKSRDELKFKLIHLFKVDCKNHIIPTYINHSRPLFPDETHLVFERCLRGERGQTYPYMLSAKQGSIWYHFYNFFGMTRSGIEPTTSGSRAKLSMQQPGSI